MTNNLPRSLFFPRAKKTCNETITGECIAVDGGFAGSRRQSGGYELVEQRPEYVLRSPLPMTPPVGARSNHHDHVQRRHQIELVAAVAGCEMRAHVATVDAVGLGVPVVAVIVRVGIDGADRDARLQAFADPMFAQHAASAIVAAAQHHYADLCEITRAQSQIALTLRPTRGGAIPSPVPDAERAAQRVGREGVRR